MKTKKIKKVLKDFLRYKENLTGKKVVPQNHLNLEAALTKHYLKKIKEDEIKEIVEATGYPLVIHSIIPKIGCIPEDEMQDKIPVRKREKSFAESMQGLAGSRYHFSIVVVLDNSGTKTIKSCCFDLRIKHSFGLSEDEINDEVFTYLMEKALDHKELKTFSYFYIKSIDKLS